MKGRTTKYVVVDENTLGYIFSDWSTHVQILHASILMGSRYSDRSAPISHVAPERVRDATVEDFKTFGISEGDWYANEEANARAA